MRISRATLAPMIRRAFLRPSKAAPLLAACIALALAACATQAPPATPDQLPAPPTTAPPASAEVPVPNVQPLEVARAAFVRDTALATSIPPAQIEAVLAKASIRDSIVKAMSRPAEAKPWRDYRPIFISQARIDGGRAFLAAHRGELAKAEAKYGVPAEIITAILGVETSYGGNTGSYPVIDALYTLAFAYPRTNLPDKIERENRREAFFRDELGQLFALGKEEGFDIATLKGSYAGAMGWGQFMPSSYREFAVDGDGDGRRDLFNDLDDVFASVANYFAKKGGWVRGAPVMVRASRDASAGDFNAESVAPVHTVEELARRGYRPMHASVPGDTKATVIRLDGAAGPEYWMVFGNFEAITKYNTSRLYATAVYQLAEAIAGRSADPQ